MAPTPPLLEDCTLLRAQVLDPVLSSPHCPPLPSPLPSCPQTFLDFFSAFIYLVLINQWRMKKGCCTSLVFYFIGFGTHFDRIDWWVSPLSSKNHPRPSHPFGMVSSTSLTFNVLKRRLLCVIYYSKVVCVYTALIMQLVATCYFFYMNGTQCNSFF